MYNSVAFTIAGTALRAMLYEVCAAPKPGLVDRENRGAHKDMDIFTFMNSSAALFPTMYRCALTGFENPDIPPQELFSRIREIGLQGEEDMFSATGGINTQKGLIFALGNICAAAGRLAGRGEDLTVKNITATVSLMVSGIVEEELKKLPDEKKGFSENKPLTAGQKLFLRYGVTGIRGEVEMGFPTVIKYGLPVFSGLLNEGVTLNDAMVNTLLHIMTVSEDTNVLWRAGRQGISHMRKQAEKAIKLGGMKTREGIEAIRKMDREFIQKNISPGGSADLLAVTVMLYLISTIDIKRF